MRRQIDATLASPEYQADLKQAERESYNKYRARRGAQNGRLSLLSRIGTVSPTTRTDGPRSVKTGAGCRTVRLAVPVRAEIERCLPPRLFRPVTRTPEPDKNADEYCTEHHRSPLPKQWIDPRGMSRRGHKEALRDYASPSRPCHTSPDTTTV